MAVVDPVADEVVFVCGNDSQVGHARQKLFGEDAGDVASGDELALPQVVRVLGTLHPYVGVHRGGNATSVQGRRPSRSFLGARKVVGNLSDSRVLILRNRRQVIRAENL